MTNAQGYANNEREEIVKINNHDISFDPNRDFPYLIANPFKCL